MSGETEYYQLLVLIQRAIRVREDLLEQKVKELRAIQDQHFQSAEKDAEKLHEDIGEHYLTVQYLSNLYTKFLENLEDIEMVSMCLDGTITDSTFNKLYERRYESET